MGDLVEDLLCLVKEYLNLKEFYLLGDKEGAALCYAYA